MTNKTETTMNNKNKSTEDSQTGNNLTSPTFQWEAPALYTQDWLETFAGSVTDLAESTNYHT